MSDLEDEPVIIKGDNKVYISGHMEYDKYNLRQEYFRDVKKGITIDKPKNYFLDDKTDNEPVFSWNAFSKEFYKNWLGSF